MKNTSKSVNNAKEVLLWLGIALITAAAFYGTYYLKFSTPVIAIIWIGWLIASLIVGYFTAKGQQVYQFATEAKVELQKVVWPSRQETVQTTSIVMIMVAVTGFILWGVDSGMTWVIAKITHLG
ncbi:preprotein translocase subunit SecE [Legionella spiritensis]|uniref:Protein translocase subunit SecE n=1 Tax=Legionella spiritensis TaxID=452 RepID=A0A0W0Z0I1_LEGSP|nr:preprotein translocase subunit SecE [Legionella spiritensis]KTD62615.1 preprotein translocase secE subunit [Legionella spiritensis]SNV30343.1 preprotein translocase secE subunit [Legionella spiritensis]VEG91904.1 preprotein translocase secE subunit [Legionella spiritensis]